MNEPGPEDAGRGSAAGPRTGRRSRLAPEERRAQLLDRARELFVERGIEATNVSDIVAAAGVAQGTFYWYFPSKEDVVRAVAEDVAADFVSLAEQVASRRGLSAVERLDQLVAEFITAIPGRGALLADFHRPEHEELHDRLAKTVVAGLIPPFARIIEQGVEEGVFDVPDPDMAAAMVLGAATGIDLPDTRPERTDPELLVGRFLEFVLRGLGHPRTAVEPE